MGTSVLIGDLDVGGAGGAGGPFEADAPLVVDADAPLAAPVATEGFEPVGGEGAEVIEGGGGFEDFEAAPSLALDRLEGAVGRAGGEGRGSLVAVGEDHGS